MPYPETRSAARGLRDQAVPETHRGTSGLIRKIRRLNLDLTALQYLPNLYSHYGFPFPEVFPGFLYAETTFAVRTFTA